MVVVEVAALLDPINIQFFNVLLSAPSVPVVLLDENRTQAIPVEVLVTDWIVRFCVPDVPGSSPSMVTLSAPLSSIIPLLAVGAAAELIVQLPPLGLIEMLV